MLRILVVEDTPRYKLELVRLLTDTLSGYEVVTVDSRDDGLAAMARESPDLLLLDLVLPSRSGGSDLTAEHGEQILRAVKASSPHVKVIIFSSEGDLVRDFLREKGADDFFTKDQPDAWEHEKLPIQLERMIGHLVCRSEGMAELRRELAAVARDATLVTLEGAMGSGKEYVASVLHRCSRRSLAEFRALDLLTLSPDTVLTELVGRRGEVHQRGLLEENPGCLYLSGLERIDAISGENQARLAAVLEGAAAGKVRYRPLEWSEWLEADTRIVVGASTPLSQLAAEGGLTAELHSALMGGPVLRVPAPAERLADVPELLHMFRRRAGEEHGAQVRRIDPSVVEVIRTLLATSPPADGWDGIARIISDAVRRAEGPSLGAEHLQVAALPERYSLVWAQEGEVMRARGSALDLAALEARDWPLVMYAGDDEPAPAVQRVILEGEERAVEDPRLGRILCLLAYRAGEVVEIAKRKRDLGIAPNAQTKRFVMQLRQLLDDTQVEARKSRFFASHYSEAYSFLVATDFLLVHELSDGA